jgi:serine protease Do
VNISAATTVDARSRTLPQLPPALLRGPVRGILQPAGSESGPRAGPGQEGGPGRRDSENSPQRQRRSNSLGSGFVVDASGIVITNSHVIGDANDITVIFSDGARLKAEIVGKDPKIDLAVLRVKSDKPLKAVPFGDSDKMRPATG